jgi:uncharacterized protein (UPF0332 family)
MSDPFVDIYLVKARESLEGASSEFANGRFDNCASRAYYACFQAAIAALLSEGIGTAGQAEQWGHDYVQARFTGDLINRRKQYPGTFRETLIRGLQLRHTADYKTQHVMYQTFVLHARWRVPVNSWRRSARK